MPFKLFYGKHPELQQIQCFGCMAYVVLWGCTHSTRLHDHPVVSKHLCPRTLPGTYLGFSNAPSTIKGQKVWLPELNCIVIAKDVRFSKLEQSETNTIPSHAPILARNSKLLHSYTWLPQHEDSDEAEPNDVAPLDREGVLKVTIQYDVKS
ncbi:uncharacterized protein UHOD_11788 [Ustilago sp. UG-2017b]|nr:uncharacterized protein UHOD_11788 [Ustilago sp. UG-2017b]